MLYKTMRPAQYSKHSTRNTFMLGKKAVSQIGRQGFIHVVDRNVRVPVRTPIQHQPKLDDILKICRFKTQGKLLQSNFILN